MTDSPLTDFATGGAVLLAGAGIGVWDPDGIYSAGQVGHMVGVLPDQPDDVIAGFPYAVGHDPALADSTIGWRLHLRGGTDPRPVLDRAAAIFDVLHGLTDIMVGGIWVVTMWQQADNDLRPDQNERAQHASTYYARVAWPSTHRTD